MQSVARLLNAAASIVLGLGIIGVSVAPKCAAADASKLPGGTWESIPKLPDMSGLWEMNLNPNLFAKPPQSSLTPKYLSILKEFQAHPAQDDPTSNCVPPGMPSIMTQPYPIEILYTPGQITLIAEAYMQVRHIYTDGRGHPDDPDLTFNGHSIGHWDGDTLVVDSVGFTLDTSIVMMNMGYRHSDKMHIVERFHLKDPKLLEITTTINDPEALTTPFTKTTAYGRHQDWTMAEYICLQNNRNFVDASGKAGINLNH